MHRFELIKSVEGTHYWSSTWVNWHIWQGKWPISGVREEKKIYVAEWKKLKKLGFNFTFIESNKKRTIQNARDRDEFVGWKKKTSHCYSICSISVDMFFCVGICMCVQSSQILFTGLILIEKEAPK